MQSPWKTGKRWCSRDETRSKISGRRLEPRSAQVLHDPSAPGVEGEAVEADGGDPDGS